jgi:P27 family predicted phage terminase small subunit
VSAPGPAPLPSHLKLVRGTARPDRMPKNEPKPKATTPRCPDWLCPEAKVIWKRVTKQLKEMNLLFTADQDVIASYCNAVLNYQRATEIVDKTGVLIKGRRDGVVTNPAVRVQRDAAQLIRQLAAELGLTPSARGRLNVETTGGGADDAFLD